ncbi:MAG: nitroreductase [Deltaproteobacteria bacterium]|nr:nitroreductase [Deltaproteobacteria bacterium]
MDIYKAIKERRSIRAFKSEPVPEDLIKRIMEQAVWAPSWANTQPWEFVIVTGRELGEIQKGFLKKGKQTPYPDVPRPYEFPEPYISRIMALPDKKENETEKDNEIRDKRNWRHYGAPAVIYLLVARSFFYQKEGINVWSLYDCGGVVQNIMLLATSYGLGTIAQAQAVVYPDIIRNVLGIPESKLIALGIAIGYPDWENLAGQARTEREPVDKIVKLYGFK